VSNLSHLSLASMRLMYRKPRRPLRSTGMSFTAPSHVDGSPKKARMLRTAPWMPTETLASALPSDVSRTTRVASPISPLSSLATSTL